jgi:mannose/fructose-specific phosphotransferase system component IIA
MTRGFLLISHGFYAKELKESLKMIAGDVDDVLYACCLEQHDGPESFTEKLKKAEGKLNQFDEVIVFADIMGGSPCNTAFQYFQSNPKYQIIAGMNFPMILTALLTPDATIDDLILAGKQALVDVRAYSSAAAADVDD